VVVAHTQQAAQAVDKVRQVDQAGQYQELIQDRAVQVVPLDTIW
jgi:hypothetical protein